MTTDLTLSDLTADQVSLIKRTVAKGVSDLELQLFVAICKQTGLNPLARQIYAIKRREKEGDQWVEKMTIQTGIDGYRLIADRTGGYAPGREPTYKYDEHGNLFSATAYVRKRTADGTWHETSATALFREYCAYKKDGMPNRMWADKPHVMLAKCAEALALRRAFPQELSALYTHDEIRDESERPAAISLPMPQSIAAIAGNIEERERLANLLDNSPTEEEVKRVSADILSRRDELSAGDLDYLRRACARAYARVRQTPPSQALVSQVVEGDGKGDSWEGDQNA